MEKQQSKFSSSSSLQKIRQNASELQKYLTNHPTFFSSQHITLKQICQIRNIFDLSRLRSGFVSYFNKESHQLTNEQMLKLHPKNRRQVSIEFEVDLQKITSQIVYISIKQLNANRCNMLIRNKSGQCLGFSWKLLKCKRFSKIMKIMSRVRGHAMVVVLDHTQEERVSIAQIEKISESVHEFLYIFTHFNNSKVIMKTQSRRSEVSILSSQKCCIERSQNELKVYSSNLSVDSQNQFLDQIIAIGKTLEAEQTNLFQLVRGSHSEQHRHLQLQFIFINIFRTYKCTPQQVIAIILNLLNQLQKSFIKKDQQQKQKQLTLLLNKSPDSHFPETMNSRKPCRKCFYEKLKKSKKVSIRCQGCSVYFKQDIPLCPQCFGIFHEKRNFYANCIRRSRIRRKQKNTTKKEQDSLILERQQQFNLAVQDVGSVRSVLDNFMISTLEKTLKLDKLLSETQIQVNKLKEMGELQVVRLFLDAYLNKSVQKMHELSDKYPELKTGNTKLGSQVAEQLQTFSQYKINYLPPFNVSNPEHM